MEYEKEINFLKDKIKKLQEYIQLMVDAEKAKYKSRNGEIDALKKRIEDLENNA